MQFFKFLDRGQWEKDQNYPIIKYKHFLYELHNTRTASQEAVKTLQFQQICLKYSFITLPYIQEIIEQIAKILNQFDFSAIHKPVKAIGSILKKG